MREIILDGTEIHLSEVSLLSDKIQIFLVFSDNIPWRILILHLTDLLSRSDLKEVELLDVKCDSLKESQTEITNILQELRTHIIEDLLTIRKIKDFNIHIPNEATLGDRELYITSCGKKIELIQDFNGKKREMFLTAYTPAKHERQDEEDFKQETPQPSNPSKKLKQ